MKICLYNTPRSTEHGTFDKVIWCPLSRDIVYIVHFFRRSAGSDVSLHLESLFSSCFKEEPDNDITFFEAEKTAGNPGERTIAFYSQSDTLANNTFCLVSGNPGYKYVCYIPSGKAENADRFFDQNKIPYHRYSYSHLKKTRPDLLVLYNDWTKAAIRLIAHCHILVIPVVCIQESIVNFGDRFRRMQFADHVMIQGVRSAMMLPRRHFYLTGNPRYLFSAESARQPDYVLINCNFTYNIYNDVRTGWLDDVTSACDELGINYIISQHPRDTGSLVKYRNVVRSSSTGIDDQFSRAGLLITRFSSLVHESLVRGVPVIYYNPHHEEMNYDFGFNPGFLAIAKEKEVLKEMIAQLYKKNISGNELESYLGEHCLPADTKSVSNINCLLSENEFISVKCTLKDLLHLIIYQPFMLGIIGKIRQVLKKTSD